MESDGFKNKGRIYRFIFLVFTCLLMCACTQIPVDPFLRGFKTTGFEPDGPVRVYNNETLFQYMNGEAEIYISFGFELLYLQTFMNSETGALILVESYDMGTALGADKIYSEYTQDQGTQLVGLGEAAWSDNFVMLFRRNNFFFRVMPDMAYENEVEPTIREMEELSRELDGTF
jgi:hypothetical protein